jgi:hypothetical protein
MLMFARTMTTSAEPLLHVRVVDDHAEMREALGFSSPVMSARGAHFPSEARRARLRAAPVRSVDREGLRPLYGGPVGRAAVQARSALVGGAPPRPLGHMSRAYTGWGLAVTGGTEERVAAIVGSSRRPNTAGTGDRRS